MVLNFQELSPRERPVLILKNRSGEVLSLLGHAFHVNVKLSYNEVSELTFDIPAYVDGEPTPDYDKVIGMRVVELKGIGQFILTDPSEQNTGKSRIKSCKAYSLEYELTFKKISMPRGTYEFYNVIGLEDSIAGRIKQLAPAWSFVVDDALIGRYRTFEVNGENLYNFIKNTLQTSYSCIFDFDTMNRVIHVREVNSQRPTKSVYLSAQNLIKSVTIDEDTESIITCLDVNGAEGVNIRDVNPIGSNKIYNLDYFLTEDNFSPEFIQKWNRWKLACQEQQDLFYRKNLELDSQKAAILAEQARLAELKEELAKAESLHSVKAEMAAGEPENKTAQQELTDAWKAVKTAKDKVAEQEKLVEELEAVAEALAAELQEKAAELKPSVYFTADEWAAVDAYIKEDALTESSFAMSTTSSYAPKNDRQTVQGQCWILDGAVTKIPQPSLGKTLYSIRGGTLGADEEVLEDELPAKIVSATLECTAEDITFSALLNLPVLGKIPEDSEERIFRTAYLSMRGKTDGHGVSDNAVFGTSPEAGEILNAYAEGTEVHFFIEEGYIYLTESATEYEQRSVSWRLYEYGTETLKKLAYPSYTFSVESANFMVLEEFEEFKSQLTLGERIYLQLDEDKLLQPFVIGLEYSFDDPTAFSIQFSDKYCASDAAFQLVDLLEQSVSMGKSVDFSKYTYREFVESGAKTEVRSFMEAALDVSKNAVLSSKNQAITWDDSGLKLRKWNDAQTDYEPDQIAMINNNIVFTENGFETVKMAIGRFYDKELKKDCFGIVAPNIVGTLLAGENLRIQAKDADGKTVLFQVDETGAKLYNASFDIVSHGHQISLNPDFGLVIGEDPIYSQNARGDLEVKKANASFYVDIKTGDAFFKGIVQANDYRDSKGNSMLDFNTGAGHYQFSPDYLNLKGLTISNGSETTFQIDKDGNVIIGGRMEFTDEGDTIITGLKIESPSIEWHYYDKFGEKKYLGKMEQTYGNNAQGDGSGTDTDIGRTILLGITSQEGITLRAEGGGISVSSPEGFWIAADATANKNLKVRKNFSIWGDFYPRKMKNPNEEQWIDIVSVLKDVGNRIDVLEQKMTSIEEQIKGVNGEISALWGRIYSMASNQ